MKDLVAFYRTRPQAEKVKDELISAGFDRDDITLYDRTGQDEANWWEGLKATFGFADEHDRQLYAEATRRGQVAVGLSLDRDDSAQRALQIMQKYQPVDLDAEASQWRQQGCQTSAQQQPTTRAAAKAGGTVVPVVEEQIQVGKREVQSGGVRVYTRVIEKPVEEQVNLREERVTVERRPVDRPLTDPDQAFRERAVEVTAKAEQPVVSKQARVVEEVVVNKDVQQHTETVRDKVRRTDVQVEQLDAAQIAGTFSKEMAADARFRGRDWGTVETDARRTFEQRYPGSKWDQFKDAIHQEYDKVRPKV